MEDNLLNISVYIINYSNEIHSPINNLKLQKILYYLQAISLVKLNQKCFESKIMKWHTGPGIPFVYQYFRIYGHGDIPTQKQPQKMRFDKNTMNIISEDMPQLDLKMKKIIQKLVMSYSNISNSFCMLKEKDNPWETTNISEEISCEKLKKYYKKHKNELYGNNLDTIHQIY